MKRLVKWALAMMVAGVVLVQNPMQAEAAKKDPLGFVPLDGGIAWMYTDGSLLTNDWLDYNGLRFYFNEKGVLQSGVITVGNKIYYCPSGAMVTGLQAIGGQVFYFGVDGAMQVGWHAIGDGIYYFGPDGAMVKDQVVNGFQLGPDGKAVIPTCTISDPELNQLVKNIIASCTTDKMTNDQKLRACYDWVISWTTYERDNTPPTGDFMGDYAKYLYTTGKGNCYRYACAFAYLARGLGYDAKMITGEICAARGGVTPHGWVEINFDGIDYIYDAELQDAKSIDLYHKTWEKYPIKPLNKMVVHELH